MQLEQTLSNEILLSVAQQYGTPVYVYDANKITNQYQKLTNAFAGQDVRFFYACKSLTNVNILRHMLGMGIGVDCSSINEVKLALYAGFAPDKVLYTSNGIAFDEIAEAVSLRVHINIDSLSNLSKFGMAYGHSYPVGLRLRPNIMAGGNLKISTGHDKSKFGIPVNQMEELLNLVLQHNIRVRTLHLHTGSEIKDVEVFARGIGVLLEVAPHFQELEVIDLGGGFKVPYRKGDSETDMVHLAQKVQEEFVAKEGKTGRHLQVWFEPGKYLVSQAGYLLVQVNVLKSTEAITFASVNSGFNHLIRPMFYDAYHYLKNISNPAGKEMHYAVVGNICETDTFAWDRKLNQVREGDLLAIYNSGAYGFEMSSNYNSRFKPAEVLVENNIPRLIRRRDNFDDLLHNVVEP
jgi:diaminopimelate decarboxylase